MAAGPGERRIQVAFGRLKVAEQQSAPSFAQTWARAASQRRRRRWGIPLAIEAAALLVAFGVIFWFSITRSRITLETTGVPWRPMASWALPTDVLLTLPDEGVFSTVPTIRESVVNSLLGDQRESVSGGRP